MKLLYAGALAAMAVFCAPQMSQAAVFAGHLEMVDNLDGTYALSYRLNEEANQGVTINIKDGTDTVIRTMTGNPTAKGLHTVQWDGKNNLDVAVSNGTYTWEVVASTNNTGTDLYVKTGMGIANEHIFGRPYALATDKNTTSSHFGNIYIGNRGAADQGRQTENGIYVLGNDLSDYTNQGDTSYKGNAGLEYPYDIAVASNSEVFVTDYTDTNSNVFVMDPENLSGNFSRLFDDTGRSTAGLNSNNGSIYSLYIEGSGPDRMLYTLDEDLEDDAGSAWAYNIGEATSGFTTTPLEIYDDSENGNLMVNFGGEIHRDTNPNRTGWFLSQYRWAEKPDEPNLFHFDGTTVDWSTAEDFTFWLDAFAFGSFDLNPDSTRLVAAGYKWLIVVDISDLNSLNDNSILFDDVGVNNSHRDIRFDAAENIIVVSNLTEQLLYYSKQGQNTFTTPNPEGDEIVIGASIVPGWELY